MLVEHLAAEELDRSSSEIHYIQSKAHNYINTSYEIPQPEDPYSSAYIHQNAQILNMYVYIQATWWESWDSSVSIDAYNFKIESQQTAAPRTSKQL